MAKGKAYENARLKKVLEKANEGEQVSNAQVYAVAAQIKAAATPTAAANLAQSTIQRAQMMQADQAAFAARKITVGPGENILSISQKTGVPPNVLLAQNGLTKLTPGQTIKVPPVGLQPGNYVGGGIGKNKVTFGGVGVGGRKIEAQDRFIGTTVPHGLKVNVPGINTSFLRTPAFSAKAEIPALGVGFRTPTVQTPGVGVKVPVGYQGENISIGAGAQRPTAVQATGAPSGTRTISKKIGAPSGTRVRTPEGIEIKLGAEAQNFLANVAALSETKNIIEALAAGTVIDEKGIVTEVPKMISLKAADEMEQAYNYARPLGVGGDVDTTSFSQELKAAGYVYNPVAKVYEYKPAQQASINAPFGTDNNGVPLSIDGKTPMSLQEQYQRGMISGYRTWIDTSGGAEAEGGGNVPVPDPLQTFGRQNLTWRIG